MVEPVAIDVDEQRVFRNYLKKVGAEFSDLSFSMGEAARIIKKESTANFILKGTGKYESLTPAYFKRKSMLAPGAPILTGAKPGKLLHGVLFSGGGISGKLKESIIGNTDDSITRVGKLSLDVGTKAKSQKGYPYPFVVQLGTKDGSTPSRPFLFLTKKMVDRIINTTDGQIALIWKTGKNVKARP